MKWLLLTSTGLANENIVIAFVPSAAESAKELEYVEESREELIRYGIKAGNIKEINLDHEIDYSEIESCDAMYVCGGNTFALLAKIRNTHFDAAIETFVNNGKVYLGVSAGSIVVTPSIAGAEVEPADLNNVGLKDLRGLNIVGFEVFPHVPEIVAYENVEK